MPCGSSGIPSLFPRVALHKQIKSYNSYYMTPMSRYQGEMLQAITLVFHESSQNSRLFKQ